MAKCRYCQTIRRADPNYRVRRANWDLESGFPRCYWHWQFVCDRCRRSVSFHGVGWCERSEQFFCIHCAPRHRKRAGSFWAWDYYYELWCEACSDYHAALDWLEWRGVHPWQKDSAARRALRGLSRKKRLSPGVWMRRAPSSLQSPRLDEIRKRWDEAAHIWDATYGEYGDAYRQNIFNPAILSLLDDVRGKKVLDAGCGAGYFSRLLAERGAKVTGVDLSGEFLEIARRYERMKPLGIRYERADLANLSRIPSRHFDLVVSVYVLSDTRDCRRAIGEIARVLKSRGRFLFLTAHPCFGWQTGGWERNPKDSERREDSVYFKVDEYFSRGTLQSQWGALPILFSFHRPLSDYFRFLKEHGFLVRDLLEPRPLGRALRENPSKWDEEDRIPPVVIIDAVKMRDPLAGTGARRQ